MSWPFTAWHGLAVRRLSLNPSEFWAMPLADWLALITPDAPALDAAALDQLMKDYPDD
jgi:hypothetical protein